MIPGLRMAQNVAEYHNVLPLSEVFGPTLQGEGPHTGRRCWFVRLGGCNLHCSWCDTPYTWDDTRYDVNAECPDTPKAAILDRLSALGASHGSTVVLSGGEPLVHHHRLATLLDHRYDWHVESNGTIAPPSWWAERVEHTTLSPKVGQDDDPAKKRLPMRSLHAWSAFAALGNRDDLRSVAWKFVCRNEDDVAAVQALTSTLDVWKGDVWIMPEGTTVQAVLDGQRALAPAVIEAGFNLTTRLHTLLWHDERGH